MKTQRWWGLKIKEGKKVIDYDCALANTAKEAIDAISKDPRNIGLKVIIDRQWTASMNKRKIKR